MRAAIFGMMVILTTHAAAARCEARVVDAAAAKLQPAPILFARLDPPGPAERHAFRSHFHFGQVSLIRSVAGGVDTSPFVTALPGEMWRGRMRSFGAANEAGFSAIAVRAKSIGFSGLQSERHVSGFLASEFRYGIAVNQDDLLTIDLSVASQRMPAMQNIGYPKSIHAGSLYLGASLIHARRISLAAGWYHIDISNMPAFDYAIERTAGMPAAGQGIRLGMDWRLGAPGPAAGPRIGIECRDGDADRDRLLPLGAGEGRERRLLLHFTEPF